MGHAEFVDRTFVCRRQNVACVWSVPPTIQLVCTSMVQKQFLKKNKGLMDYSFFSFPKVTEIMNTDDIYFSVFVRDPLERLVSGYIDKCVRRRGSNMCPYAKWGDQFKKKFGQRTGSLRNALKTPPFFSMWADGLIQCPCWPETDVHFAPQSLFCNLWAYKHLYDVFRFENKTFRLFLCFFCLSAVFWNVVLGVQRYFVYM